MDTREREEIIKGEVLSRLKRKNVWGNRHVPGEKIYKRVAKKSGIGAYKKAIRDLVREGVLIDHAKSYGAYSLNVRMKRVIEGYIEKYEIYKSKNNLTKR